MRSKKPTYQELKAKLAEAEEIIAALRREEVDAVVVNHHVVLLRLKDAEEALRESEKRYRTILKSIEESYYEVDLAGNLTFFNDSTCGILGYTRDELVGINNRQFMDQENAEKVYQTFNKVYTTGKPVKASDWEIMRKDGTRRFVETSVSLIKDAGGQPTGFRGIGRDITERKQAEETLRESEERYRSLVESTEDSIYLVDRECRYLFMNIKHLLRFSLTLDEVTGRSYGEFHSKKETNEFAKRVNEVFETARSLSYEYKSERDGGYYIRTLSPVKGADGEIITVTVDSKDITERKQAEAARLKAEKHFRKVIENIFKFVPEGLLAFTERLELFRTNKAFQGIVKKYSAKLHYTGEELTEILIEQVKNRIVNKDYSEIRISKSNNEEAKDR